MIFTRVLKEVKGVSHGKIWRSTTTGKESSHCEGSEIDRSLVHSQQEGQCGKRSVLVDGPEGGKGPHGGGPRGACCGVRLTLKVMGATGWF